jgi:signal transduction histidine kinase/ligand-binding sensor domain-containing protein
MKTLLFTITCPAILLKICFLILFFIPGIFLFGREKQQAESLFVTPFGVDQGLRQSMVTHVIQDSNGLIWMTTGDGLHCFDGKEFRSFRVVVNSINSHSDNLMRDLVESAPGILTLSSSSSIIQFNSSTGKFNIVFRKEGSYPILLDALIDQKPAAWLSGLNLCLIRKDQVIPQKLIFEDNTVLPVNFYPTNAARATFGELLLYNDNGILIVGLHTLNAKSRFRAKWMSFAGCQSVSSDKSGQVFILARGKLYKYMGKGQMTLYYDTGIKDKMNLYIDTKDNFWLTNSESNKQYKLSQGNLSRLNFCLYDGKHTDPIFPNIRSVFEDRYHNIWFGTDNNGVLLYSPGKVQLLRSDIGFTRCLTWFSNEIWAGTYNEGLWRISPDLSRAQLANPGNDKNSVYYLDLADDRKGRIWIATRQGLEVRDRSGQLLFRHPFLCKSAKLFIHTGDTVSLFCDKLLYHYFSGDRISKLESLEFVSVSSFLCTNEAYWIGNQFGLYRCRKSAVFDKDLLFVARNQLSANAVYSLIMHDGSIWTATGNGIEIFDLKGKKRPVPPVIQELRNEVIYSLLADGRGQVWFTGNRGIGCINERKDHIIYLRTQNNLQSLEFNYNAACSSPDGKLYFGGIRGINGFDPAWFNPIKKTQRVRLISLFVSDTAYTEGIPPDFIKLTLSRLSPHISGKVVCTDYTNAGSQLFSFYLEGYHKEWSKPAQNADFIYRDLPPGKYRLLVKCADSWQNWGEPVTLLSITVNPPFWITGWFFFLVAMVITTITALIVRRINSIRYQKRIHILEQQNAIEKERLRISKDMHDEIGASLTRISILSELAKNQKDNRDAEMRVISQISDIAGGVVDEMSEIIWAMNPKNDTLDNFAAYFRQYASSYLETAGINAAFRLPEIVPSIMMSSELRRNLFLTIKESLHNIVKHSEAKNVKIQMTLNQKVLRMTIMDDGRGFIIEKTNGWGNGLINMRKRMEEPGGTFDIGSEIGKGTTIQLSIILPVNDKSH